jgi:hypothetical protein
MEIGGASHIARLRLPNWLLGFSFWLRVQYVFKKGA